MTNTIHLPAPATCSECGFTTGDAYLLWNHSCGVQSFGGRCEDFPCCGHEAGDCNGLLYGSDEAIKEDAARHINCEHEHGFCDAYDDEEPDEDDDPAHEEFIAQELEYEATHCGATFTTPGSDPWVFTCDKAKDHPRTEQHSMDNPMGPDTPTFTWR